MYDLVQALLEGRAPVLSLLDSPFPDAPPKYVRVLSFRYRFTTPAERQASGDWWHVDDPRLWLEPVQLKKPVIRHEPLTLD